MHLHTCRLRSPCTERSGGLQLARLWRVGADACVVLAVAEMELPLMLGPTTLTAPSSAGSYAAHEKTGQHIQMPTRALSHRAQGKGDAARISL